MTEPRIPSQVRRLARALLASELKLDDLEPAYKQEAEKNRDLRAKLNGLLTDLGFSSVNLDGIGRITATFQGPYASIEKNEDGSTSDAALERLREWAGKNGLTEVIFKSSPNVQRLASLVKTALEGDGEFPPGVTYYLNKGVSLTRAKSVPAKKRK